MKEEKVKPGNGLYRVNEIFYSLQGEGRWTGRASIFIRFAGCNLNCPFCDTDYSEGKVMLTSQIIKALAKWKCNYVILTGGEPTLQVDEDLVIALHEHGYMLSMETNGTRRIPGGIDWITCSPKQGFLSAKAARVVLHQVQELKVVFDGIHPVKDYGIMAFFYYIQPCDTGDPEKNKVIIQKAVEFIKKNPGWQLSLQTHKILDIK